MLGTSATAPANLKLTFQRRAAPALTYVVEASADLITWGPTPIWTSSGAQNLAGPVTVTDPANPGTTPQRFLRLRVTAP